MIGPEIGEEVQADVEKREEAEHAPEANEVREIQELAQRSDGERDQQEAQRPVSGEVLNEFDGIGGEVAIDTRARRARRAA